MTPPSSNARAGLLIILVAALFTYGLIRIFSIRFATGDVYPEYSSMRSSPTGAKLLYESLARTPGVLVSRNFFPLEYVEANDAAILMLNVNAAEFASASDLASVERLAKRGNRVVVALGWQNPKAPEHTDELQKRWNVKYGFDADKKRPHHLYFEPAAGWQVLDRDGIKILAMERGFEKGGVVLISNSFDFSNEATVGLERLKLVTAAIGTPTHVIFDEQHFGISESGTIVGLARRYRLTGMAAGLALCAALFLWKNGSSFPPPESVARGEAVAGRTTLSGLHTLLRRHVKSEELAATCWNEWIAANRSLVTPDRMARAQSLLRDFSSRPLDAVREIQSVLHSKGPL